MSLPAEIRRNIYLILWQIEPIVIEYAAPPEFEGDRPWPEHDDLAPHICHLANTTVSMLRVQQLAQDAYEHLVFEFHEIPHKRYNHTRGVSRKCVVPSLITDIKHVKNVLDPTRGRFCTFSFTSKIIDGFRLRPRDVHVKIEALHGAEGMTG